MSRKIIGLDIRPDTVSAVLIDSSLRENRIEKTVTISVPEAETPAEGLKSALEGLESGILPAGAVCVAAFPANQVSYRNLRIPFKGDKKIGQVLPFELEPMLPFPADELITDFHTIRSAPDQPDQTDIIALSVRKSDLKSYLDTLSDFGLDPKTVMPGGYPSVVCLNSAEDIPENWILLDVQERQAGLYFIISGKIHLMRCFPLTSPADAKGEGLYAVMEQTLAAFEDIFSHPFEAEKVILSGIISENSHAELSWELESRLRIPVALSHMRRTFEKRIKIPADISWQEGRMDNALALALSEMEGKNGINFRKGVFATRKDWAVHKKNLITAAAFTLVILLLLLCNILIDFSTKSRQIEKLDQQIEDVFRSAFPDVKRIVNPLHQMQVAMDELRKNAPVAGEGVPGLRVVDLLNDISRRIPKEIDVEFSRMVADPENLLISGNTDTFNSVDSIQTALEGSPLFKKVTISSTNRDKKKNRVNFKIKVDL